MSENIIHLGIPNSKISPEKLKTDPCISQFCGPPVFFLIFSHKNTDMAN